MEKENFRDNKTVLEILKDCIARIEDGTGIQEDFKMKDYEDNKTKISFNFKYLYDKDIN